jgi:hypothetical protein
MYGLSQYLMALQEVERARLAARARVARREGEGYPSRQTPKFAEGLYTDRRNRRRQ